MAETNPAVTLKSINDLQRHTEPILPALNEVMARVLQSGWFVLGPEVTAFEHEFATYCGSTNCVSLANGTDALELALRGLGIGKGHNVLTVANAGMYSSTAILATGATPLYAEISPSTLLLDAAKLPSFLDHCRVDAIIATHLYGRLCDIKNILQIARDRNIPLIEDCAQAHGAALHDGKAGTFGDIGCFSFYPTKNLGALGDGGAIITSRPELAKRVEQLRQYGWEGKYQVAHAGGRNSRLDEIQAAMLRVQLPLLDRWNARRREIAARYSSGIIHTSITTPPVPGEEYVAHLYIIRTKERDRLKKHLAEVGIPSDIHYPVPDYMQPAYQNLLGNVRLEHTEQACAEVLTLPCFPELTDAEVDAIIARVNSW